MDKEKQTWAEKNNKPKGDKKTIKRSPSFHPSKEGWTEFLEAMRTAKQCLENKRTRD